MKKLILSKEIFREWRHANEYTKPFTYGEVKAMLAERKIQLEDNDYLVIAFEEEETNTYANYYVSVTRQVEETDDEFERRKKHLTELAAESKERRRAQYEKLKKEFEGEDKKDINT